jgi:hypothetical protein
MQVQRVLLAFGPALLLIFEQLTQTPLMITLETVGQVQVFPTGSKVQLDGQ